MHVLMLALIGITVTQPPLVDQAGDVSWTAPGYTVEEIVTIDPLNYGEPIGWAGEQACISCQMFFVETDQGEKWRMVIVFKDKVTILQEDEEQRDIPLTCTPQGGIYSRGGRYMLVQGSLNSRPYDELISIDTGEVTPYQFRQQTGWSGYVYVCDNGSTARSSYGQMFRSDPGQIQIIDSDLNVLVDWVDQATGTMEGTRNPIHLYNHGSIGVAANGSLFLRSFRPEDESTVYVTAYDGYGNILWESSDCMYMLITSDGEYLILADGSDIITMDASTGETLRTYPLEEGGLNAPTCSPTGHAWAVQLRHGLESGLIWGTDPSRSDDMNVLSYFSEEWDHVNPYRVSELGSILGLAVALPNSGYPYHVQRFCLLNNQGGFIWISSIFSIGSSPLMIHSCNSNLEHELGSIPCAIQANGMRFAYSDYEMLRVFEVVGGGE